MNIDVEFRNIVEFVVDSSYHNERKDWGDKQSFLYLAAMRYQE